MLLDTKKFLIVFRSYCHFQVIFSFVSLSARNQESDQITPTGGKSRKEVIEGLFASLFAGLCFSKFLVNTVYIPRTCDYEKLVPFFKLRVFSCKDKVSFPVKPDTVGIF